MSQHLRGAHLVYTCDADGTTRFSNIRLFGQISRASGDWASRIAARNPLGAEVEVTYDPEDPDRAVLEPGIGSKACWLPGAGVAFLLFGLAALLRGPCC